MDAKFLLAVAFMLGAGLATPTQGQELSRGQTVYVPVYSRVMHGRESTRRGPETVAFSTMLSIRNVDIAHKIAVRSVRYYDTDGKLLKEEAAAEHDLGPLGTESVFISYENQAGGAGANFIVVWDADTPVDVPIIETVNIHYLGTQAATIVTRGQVIHNSPPKQ
jgi:hypothetical protein